MKIDALLDSNVLIATLVEAHEHHGPSLDLLVNENATQFAVAAHSYAEAYSTLTRRGERAPFQLTSEEAWAALESVRAVTVLVGLTAPQTFEAIRSYSQGGGVGARLYDRLIGQAAVAHGIPAIVTWNVGHMRSLFPNLNVATPKEFEALSNQTL
ncbi:type II toxin-antitoxin system VapC family toxin [Phenylobacterium sp.]|uniref:type II toxin-antitoxin system VapC family toxin n=1 Tax=Phenylobacterium sp. TaxID=1871053 RepID=UPI002E313602|nr:PIN domain-containing protein [Phenylobacterium sp.]HEX3365772.1 PIN domain-containing protein [Phenylobacterium sp.]